METVDTFPLCEDRWQQDVWLLARRMALLYYHMADAIVKRLGEEEGKKLIREAIWAYGQACGRRVREEVDRQGLPADLENYSTIPDLPSKGWLAEHRTMPDGEVRRVTTFCPLAAVWKELGAEELGRLYCLVDVAKFDGYRPGLRAVHTKNVLDGDPYCLIDFKETG
ncbi:MAG TPA: L-2-amino-thiazoline-4-carboxylic acid hydrolase [Firmicutes bacterium]|nr:L-2-amino-thiazoline-4-carboxylic acid hydrolase [Candidatus Fermentithermobacillaceae bacterium]